MSPFAPLGLTKLEYFTAAALIGVASRSITETGSIAVYAIRVAKDTLAELEKDAAERLKNDKQ